MEPVWDYPRPPRCEPTSRRIQVRLGNLVVADTRRAYRVLETSHPPSTTSRPPIFAWSCWKLPPARPAVSSRAGPATGPCEPTTRCCPTWPGATPTPRQVFLSSGATWHFIWSPSRALWTVKKPGHSRAASTGAGSPGTSRGLSRVGRAARVGNLLDRRSRSPITPT